MSDSKGSGCFSKGCVILLIIFGSIGLIAIASAAYGYNKIRSLTSTAPAQLPTVEAGKVDEKTLAQRLDEFQKSAKAGQEGRIEFTADEINTLIAKNKELNGRFYVELHNDEARIQASVPLNGVPAFKDRYLNASATVKVSIQNGAPHIQCSSIESNGKVLPPQLLQPFEQGLQQGFTAQVEKNPSVAATFARIKSFAITESKVVIEINGTPSSSSSNKTPSVETSAPSTPPSPPPPPQDIPPPVPPPEKITPPAPPAESSAPSASGEEAAPKKDPMNSVPGMSYEETSPVQ